jgi:flagellar hook-associated protein 1 FlgK
MDFNLSNEILADVAFIAASITGNTGDNQIALMMTDLRLEKVFDGQTLTEAFADFVFTVGQDIRFSKSSSDRADLITQQTDNFRESVKGVSMNEETANLMKFQQSLQAAAKIMSIADDMLKVIIGLVR